jgi:hypothetical protein
MIGGGIVLFEDLLSSGIEQIEQVEEEVHYVQVTQVNLAKKSKHLPDKASQVPREEAQPVEKQPTRTESQPKTSKAPTSQTPPPAQTSNEPSFEDIMKDLPSASNAPEGSQEREATDAEGSDQPVLGLSDVGPNTPIGRWMTECGEAIRRVIFVGDDVVSGMDPNGYVVFKVTIDEDGTVSDPEKDPTRSSGNWRFDGAIRSGLKRSPRCPPRPPEAAEFSNRTRIRVPVRDSE